MTTLLLVRHGETPDNARHIMQGQIQGELNDVGIAQAEALAARLAEDRIDAIVASDLHRAIQTAEIIARPHSLPVVTTPLLRERDWGDFTGRYIPDLEGVTWPDNVEPLDKLLQRARLFLEYVRQQWPGGRVLAVGHGIVNKAVQAVHNGVDMRQVQRMTNAELRVLELM